MRTLSTIIMLCLLSGCATPEAFKARCRHEAMFSALVLQEQYPDGTRIDWMRTDDPKVTHAQACVITDGKAKYYTSWYGNGLVWEAPRYSLGRKTIKMMTVEQFFQESKKWRR